MEPWRPLPTATQSLADGQDTLSSELWVEPFGSGTALVAFQVEPFQTSANVPFWKTPMATHELADGQDTESSLMSFFRLASEWA